MVKWAGVMSLNAQSYWRGLSQSYDVVLFRMELADRQRLLIKKSSHIQIHGSASSGIQLHKRVMAFSLGQKCIF